MKIRFKRPNSVMEKQSHPAPQPQMAVDENILGPKKGQRWGHKKQDDVLYIAKVP